MNKENFNLEKFNLEKFNLENVDKNEIKRFFNENTNNLKIELTKLQSDMLSAYVSENDFKNLRLFLIENFKTNQKGSITLNLIKLLFIIYLNKDNKYEFLNKLIYGNKSNDIVIGMIRDCYIELYLENKNLPRNDAFKKGDIDNFLPQNNYIFPFDASIINSGRSNIFDITNRFVRQYQANANVINKELNKINNLFITFNKKNANIIFEYFDRLKKPAKSNTVQEIEEEEIENIYSYKEYIDKYNHESEVLKLNDLNENKNNENILDKAYIPEETIKMSNIHTLLNKFGEFEFDFLLSPLIKRKNFSLTTPEEILTRTKIKIVQKEFMSMNEYEKMVSKLKYVCPNCETKVQLNINDLTTEVAHICDSAMQKKTKINQTGIYPQIQTPVMLYKCEVCTNYDEVLENGKEEKYMKEVYIYSFKLDIEPGFYIGDITKFYEPLNILAHKNKKAFVYFLLGFKKLKIKYIEDKIIKNTEDIKKLLENENVSNDAKLQFIKMREMEDDERIQKHKLFNILFSIRQYYKNRFRMNIDNSGMLTQINALISVIARNCFKENKIALSIMGVGSVSKTFPCNMIFNITDLNYKYISDSARMTSAGMTGGINTSAIINGVQVKKFEQGAISNNGMVVFDESQSVFLNQNIQAVIKSIPQDEYDISVIGGAKIDFNCTPIFLANFNEFMMKYEKRIIDAYVLKYKSTYKYENERKLRTNQDIIKYVSKINLYQNIEYYYDIMGDELLANIVFAVRKQYESERIDWKTGSQIEAMNRILFDCVVHRKTYQIDVDLIDSLLEEENTRDINLNENMPVQQVNEEMLRYIYKEDDLDKIMKINLNDESKNSFERIEQLEKLNKSVHKFLTKETLGKNISLYYIQNVDNFDKKIRELVKKVIKMVQLIEDIDSTELSENTKKFANSLLLKCKRGLIQEEYDWEINVSEIKIYPKLNTDFLIDLEDNKTELYYEQKRKQDMESLEKDIENKYGLTKKEKDESLNEKNIKLDDSELGDDFGDLDSLEDLNKEYDLKSICKKLNFENEDETKMIEFVKKCKKNGAIYEPRNNVYKIYKG